MKFSNKIVNVKTPRSLLAIAVGTSLSAVTIVSTAQDTDEYKVEKVERIQVTGSRIRRTDMETAIPVTTITKSRYSSDGFK